MGAIWFRGNELVATVSEMVGFKTGLALTRDRVVKLLADSIEAEGFFEAHDDTLVRVRSEELEVRSTTLAKGTRARLPPFTE